MSCSALSLNRKGSTVWTSLATSSIWRYETKMTLKNLIFIIRTCATLLPWFTLAVEGTIFPRDWRGKTVPYRRHYLLYFQAFLHLECDHSKRRGHWPDLWDNRERSFQPWERFLRGGDSHGNQSRTHHKVRDATQKKIRDFLGIFPKGGVFSIPKTFAN